MFCQRWEALPRSIPLTGVKEIPFDPLGVRHSLLPIPYSLSEEGNRSLAVTQYLKAVFEPLKSELEHSAEVISSSKD
jgi:hypothetical protein